MVISLHFRVQDVLAIHGGHNVRSWSVVAAGEKRQRNCTNKDEQGEAETRREKGFELQLDVSCGAVQAPELEV
jgi:hypothetical protein